MNNKPNGVKPKWYQMPRWRWIPPGGYYGGFFSGFGLGIMMLALVIMEEITQLRYDIFFAVGAAIMVVDNLVCYYLEKMHDDNSGQKEGE